MSNTICRQNVSTLTYMDHVYISCLWFGYHLQWGALLPVLLPIEIEKTFGAEQKELFNGMIGAVGALTALIITPLAGSLSDRSRNRYGRRRPYIVSGICINVIFLLLISGIGQQRSPWLLVIGYIGVQFGCNWWGGPYAGLVPDLVPADQRGRASSFMMLMTALGVSVGALAAGYFDSVGFHVLPYYLIASTLILTLTITLVKVNEKRNQATFEPTTIAKFCRSFFLSPGKYSNFYLVLLTRAFMMMGIYSVFSFFQYFLKDIIKVPDPTQKAALLIGVITIAGIPSSIVGGELSDKYGRKPPIYISGSLMVVATTALIVTSFYPSWSLTIFGGVLFGIGNGAYHSVDWALAIDVLPNKADVAKDMGVWHVAIVLPQVLAPALTGLIIAFLKNISLQSGYSVAFIITIIWFSLGTLFVRSVRIEDSHKPLSKFT